LIVFDDSDPLSELQEPKLLAKAVAFELWNGTKYRFTRVAVLYAVNERITAHLFFASMKEERLWKAQEGKPGKST
jgi:hypothetical protein